MPTTISRFARVEQGFSRAARNFPSQWNRNRTKEPVMTVWTNWSRTATSAPASVHAPRDESELSDVITAAAQQGGTVKAVGSGHSFTDCATTTGTLVRLDHFTGIEWIGPAAEDGS